MIVPSENAQALARALAILHRDPLQQRRFGEAGRRCAEMEFTIDRMSEGTMLLYERLLLKTAVRTTRARPVPMRTE